MTVFLLASTDAQDARADDPGIDACIGVMKWLGMRPDTTALKTPSVSATGDRVLITGEITPKTLSDFKTALQRNRVATVALNSGGGDIPSGFMIAQEIHGLGLSTEIVENGLCDSICTGIFQAGSTRTMSPKSVLGYHNALIGQDSSKPATAAGIAVLILWGLDPAMAGAILKTPATSLYCVDPAEALRVHAATRLTGPPVQDPNCGGGLLCDVPDVPNVTRRR